MDRGRELDSLARIADVLAVPISSFYEVTLCQPLFSFFLVLLFFRRLSVSGLARADSVRISRLWDHGRDAPDPEPPSNPSTCLRAANWPSNGPYIVLL